MYAPNVKFLRFTAIFGTLFVAIKYLFWFEPLQPRQVYGYFAVWGIAFAVFVTLIAVFDSTKKLFRNLDLFVPLGLYVFVSELIDLIPAGAVNFNLFGEINYTRLISQLTFTILVSWILQIVSAVIFTGWITRLILQLVKSEKVNLIRGLFGVKEWFWRVFAVLAVFKSIPFILILPWLLSPGKLQLIHFFVIFFGIFALFFNLTTYAVLLFVLSERKPLFSSIANGIKMSWKNKAKVAVPVILQMLILGWVVFVSVNFTIEERSQKIEENFGKTTSVSESLTNKSKFNFSTNLAWVGDYDENSDWHKKLMEAFEAKPLPSADFKISLLLLLLAIAVKIEFVRKLFGENRKKQIEYENIDFELKNIEILLQEDKLKFPQNTFIFITTAIIFLMPFEYFLQSSFDIKSSITNNGNSVNKTDISTDEEKKLIIPKIYRGENVINKREFFVNKKTEEEKSVKVGIGVSIAGTKPKLPEKDYFEINEIKELYAGEIDDEPGIDILAAESEKAFILDAQGNIKKKINYNLGTYYDETKQDYRLPFIKIVDVDSDGKPEIAGHGSRICLILDTNGKVIWKYKGVGKGEDIDVDAFAVGDVDNDGKNEVVVGNNDKIEVYNQNGALKWTTKVSSLSIYDVEVADFDGDGKNEIIAEKLLFDGKGKLLKEIKKPYSNHGYLVQQGENPSIILFDNNKLGLFDGNEKLRGNYDAPLSYVPKPKDESSERNLFDSSASIFKAKAFYVKLNAESEKYLAVLGTSVNDDSFNILYIYDSQKKLIYYETIDSFNGVMSILPKENNTESILVSDDGRVFEYSLK